MSTVSPTPAALHVGQRVHHKSFGAGRVSEVMPSGVVRVLFSSGLEPLMQAASLAPVPDGFEPVHMDDGRVSDYARLTRRDGFDMEELVLQPSGEAVVWISVTNSDPWISIAQARELVQVLESAIAAAEA